MGIYLLKVDNKNTRCEIKVYNESTTSVRVFVNFGRISHFLSVSIVDFEQANACWGIKKCRVVVPFWKTSAEKSKNWKI